MTQARPSTLEITSQLRQQGKMLREAARCAASSDDDKKSVREAIQRLLR